MSASFIRELSERVRLEPKEEAVLRHAGVHSYASLYNLLVSFPSITEAGLVNRAKLSSAAAQAMPAMVAAIQQSPPPAAIPIELLGAMHPPGAPVPVGTPIGGAGVPGYSFGASAPG